MKILNNSKKFMSKVFGYIKYNLVDKWNFVLLQLSLDEDIYFMPELSKSLIIRLATNKDISKIKEDIYPYLKAEEVRHDSRFFERIGDDDFACFIAIENEKIVHYFLIHKHAEDSPLVRMPFNRSLYKKGVSYIGTAFTSPEVRGMWIMPLSLSKVLKYLRDIVKSEKAYVIVHKDTAGAEDFYKRLGFEVVNNPYKGFYSQIIRMFLKYFF